MGIELPLTPRPVPLFRLENGVYRVTNSRIPLERIVEMHKEGATPEQIVEAFITLQLSDVYTLIGYYLDNRTIVDDYMRLMDELGDAMEGKIKAEMPLPPGFKQQLKERWARMQAERDAQVPQ